MSIKNYIMIYNKLNKVNNKFLVTFTKKRSGYVHQNKKSA